MVSIRDVAKHAGVSPTTVSAVINGLDCVKASTKEKVQNSINALGYTPNFSARELVTRRKQNIGFIAMVQENFEQRRGTFDVGSDMFYFDYFQEIAREFADSEYGLLYENFYFDEKNPTLPKMISQKRVDSVFVLGGLQVEEFLKILKKDVSNIVALGCVTDLVDCVHNDYYKSAYHCVQYLIGYGHRRIALVNGDVTLAYYQKKNAYLQAIKDAGIVYRENLIFDAKYTANSGYAVAKEIMALPEEERPTAIFFADDIIAVGAYRYFQECGVRIPEDISVVGYENLIVSDFVSPPLTTIDFNKVDIGNRAAKLMKQRMHNSRCEIASEVVPYRLIERKSVKSI